MAIPAEISASIKDLIKRSEAIADFLDVSGKKLEINRLETEMATNNFWNNQENAQNTVGKVSDLKTSIKAIIEFRQKLDDAMILAELIDQQNDNEEHLQELSATVGTLANELDSLELVSFLNQPQDHCNAIFSIHAGAGGTESCDWADMLFRMYMRWAERRGFTVEVQDIQEGDGVGLNSITLRLVGKNAYGYAKAERGVHRLVRLSPFDANHKRHTSFCSVDVIAEIEDDIAVNIQEDDIRIDTYRSSGKGGQHVNKTESAIRITHLPTGIVVTCQNERSQYKNKDSAMKTLRARIYERMQDEKRSEMDKFYGEKGEIGWGNQIRSYVFQPYQLVKDLRTGVEGTNLQAIMDGDIDMFINAWLKAGCPKTRKQ
ncbi:MAG: peptide chain release factor 2 [Puniceicoccales bacterium]|jgi:peptide chain release factor 2|nr:peptide chain release factor 2 [Puniceicoccales bacterium]